MQLTLATFQLELTALAARCANSRAHAVTADLHTPYYHGGRAPGEQALHQSLYALETYLRLVRHCDSVGRCQSLNVLLVVLGHTTDLRARKSVKVTIYQA
jgi:hypothetical protein